MTTVLDRADYQPAQPAAAGEHQHRPQRGLPSEPRRKPGEEQRAEELACLRGLIDDAVAGADVLRRPGMDR